jgi:hypothetical protein
MGRLARVLNELADQVPRCRPARTLLRCLVRRHPGTVRRVGREIEELERRDVPALLGQELFPADNPWNQNIANAPVAANSAAIISHIGSSITVHPDWGEDSSSNTNDPLYGIPFNVVHGNSVPKVNVIIDGYPSESDIVPVPIPANAVIEGDYQSGPNLNGPGYNDNQRGDSHLIIWDEDNNIAYELYEASRPTDSSNTSGKWEAVQETVWNMNTDTFRTLGFTSADAAGLSILAGLVRPDEGLPVSQGGQGAIDHALRLTLPSGDINPQYIFPAEHEIDVSSQSSTKLPMGARLRLENTPAVDALIAKMDPEAQVIATAMQQYGLILADDGSPMYVTGTSASENANNAIDLTWNMDDVLGLESLTAGDFQVLNLTPVVSGISGATGQAGSTVTITGQNFSGSAGELSVFFGANASPSVTFVSDTEITAVIPSGSGTVNVTVQSGQDETDTNSDNPNANVTAPVFGYGVSSTSAADQFTYVTQTVSASDSSVLLATSTLTSGTTEIVTFVIEDTSGTVISGLPSSAFTFSFSGGTSTSSLGSVTTTSTPGTYTAVLTGAKAGTPSGLVVTVDGVQLDSDPTFVVTPGAPGGTQSTASFTASTDTSGTSDTVTIQVEDAAGNAITGLAPADFALSLSGGSSTGTFGAVAEVGNTDTYTASFTGVLAGTAGSLNVTVNSVALVNKPKVTVVAGAVSGGGSTVSVQTATVTSGLTDQLTITVKDAAGNAIARLPGSAFAFVFGGGTSTGSVGTVTQTSTPGVYTAALTGALAGTPSTLAATVSGVQLTSGPSIQVKAAGVSGTKTTATFTSSTVGSGLSDPVTIVVEDAAGNAITGLAASGFSLTLAGGTSTGTFSSVVETSTPGTYTAAYTGLIAGTADTLTLKVSGVSVSSQPTVAVTPGSVSGTKSTAGFAATSVTSGGTDKLTLVVKDAGGNVVTGLPSSAFSFAFASGSSKGTFGTVTETTTHGTYTVVFTGTTAGTTSSVAVTIEGVPLAVDPSVTVKNGAVSGSVSSAAFALSTVASGQTDQLTISVADANGNPVSGLAASAFSLNLSGGKSTGSFSSVTATSTPGTYSTTFTGLVAGTGSTLTLKVNGITLVTKPTVQVTAGAVSSSKSTVSVAATTLHSGSTDLITIAVKDADKNAISGLLGTAFSLTFAGGKSTCSIGNVTETATPGTYSVLLTGVTAGTASTLSVQLEGTVLTTLPKITVLAGAVNGGMSTFGVAASTVAAGQMTTVTITVEDAAGNPITGLASSAFVLTLSGGTSKGTFGTVKATTTPGVYTVSFKGVTAGTPQTLAVKVNGVFLADDVSIDVG